MIYCYVTPEQKARIERAAKLRQDTIGNSIPVYHYVVAAALAAAARDLAASRKGGK